MREILFRGRRIDNGEWVEGYFVHQGNEAYIFTQEQVDFGIDIGGFLDCCQMNEVDPATIGQYTGLKDVNGQRIFEGDILKEKRFGNKYFIHVVGFGESSFGTRRVVNEKFDSLFIPFDDLDNPMCTWLESEVIGNIHDNKELLKEVR